jgi:hypothetical protein
MAAGCVVLIASCSKYAPAPPPPSAAQPAAAKQTPAKPGPGAATAGQQGQSAAQTGQQGSGMTAGMSAMGGAIGMAPLETAVGGPGAVPPARADANPGAPAMPPGAPPGTTVVGKAQVGSGEKGRGYGAGLIATPAATYFQARERIAFEIQIPHALQLYKATNGVGPKTHQEFEQKILKEQRIELPTLPPGHFYQYDPNTEQLMVMKPSS